MKTYDAGARTYGTAGGWRSIKRIVRRMLDRERELLSLRNAVGMMSEARRADAEEYAAMADALRRARERLVIADTHVPAAARDVIAERRRQWTVEGWTAEHDDEHDAGDLSAAAAAYAMAAADKLHPLSQGDGDYASGPPLSWPWERTWWKPADPRRMLVKAAALILAEIDRIDRSGA